MSRGISRFGLAVGLKSLTTVGRVECHEQSFAEPQACGAQDDTQNGRTAWLSSAWDLSGSNPSLTSLPTRRFFYSDAVVPELDAFCAYWTVVFCLGMPC